MKTKLLLFAFLIPTMIFSQELSKETINEKIAELKSYIKAEKAALKENIKAIDQLFENGDITENEANERKGVISEETSMRIEEKVNNTLEGLNEDIEQVVEEALETSQVKNMDSIIEHDINIVIKTPAHSKSKTSKKKPKGTYDRLIFAVGLNNVIQDNELNTLDNTPYSIWGSNFVELGWGYRTAFNPKNQVVGLDYGINVLWKELKLFDNQYHVNLNDETLIATHEESLKKSKLRTTQLMIPVFLDIDFSKRPCEKNGEKMHRRSGLKFGLGGYAGLRINTKQIIKFNEPRDAKKEKIKDDYNMNNLSYGLAGYIGYDNISLYTKYDLHPLFKNTNTSNVALGLRFDF